MHLKFSFRTVLILVACLSTGTLKSASGYIKLGPVWPGDAVANMQLQLGPTDVGLEDGFATWDESAADALMLWNPHMDIFQFAWTKEANISQMSGDGFNSVFFSSSVFGDDFGPAVLAVTVLLYDTGNTGEVSKEGDVLINQAFQFNSYLGPLKPGDPETLVYDIHRVFLHEFGHVLGLDHADAYGQRFTAIMNSVISDLDSLATDDIQGAHFLYDLRITSPGELDLKVGEAADFQLTANAGVTYEAAGLPPGLASNSVTGIITGTVDVTGGFSAQITAHGARADVTAPLFVYVTSTDEVGELRQIWRFTVNRLITDPLRNRIYASVTTSNLVAVIDGVKLTILKAIPVASEPSGLAISADGNTLFVAERGETNPEIGVIDLDTLDARPSLPAPFPSLEVAAGLDDRLFVTSWGDFPADIAQLDSNTGDLLAAFPSGLPYGLLQISPDRKTLYLCDAARSPSTIYSFDVSSDFPVLLEKTPFNLIGGVWQTDFALSHDGTRLCARSPVTSGFADYVRFPATDLSAPDGGYLLPNGGYAGGAIAFSSDDTSVFISEVAGEKTGVDIFDADSQVYQRSVFTNDYIAPTTMTTDTLGKYLFAGSFEVAEIRVYALGSTGLPSHVPKSESLLNVSTRLNTEPGDKTLIGGFIVTGDTPKNILIRGLGPTLPLQNALSAPEITLYDAAGDAIASNVFWENGYRIPILLSGLAPESTDEAALYVTLFPGSYTVTLLGLAGIPGVGLLEVYDISADSEAAVANLSTRGHVGTGYDVMIGGFILSQDQPTKVLLRAIGPSLTKAGISDPLQDPVLELHGPNGDLIVSNDNWRDTQKADIEATGLAPSYDKESAILAILDPGPYTAIVRGHNDTTGIALVEIYNLASPLNGE